MSLGMVSIGLTSRGWTVEEDGGADVAAAAGRKVIGSAAGRKKKRRSAHGNGERRTETGLRGDVVSDGVTTRARTWPDDSKRRRSNRTRHRLVYGRDSYGCEFGTSDVEVYTL